MSEQTNATKESNSDTKKLKIKKMITGLQIRIIVFVLLLSGLIGVLWVKFETDVNDNPLKKVNGSDWIRGKENAPITIIEFADPECPYCKDVHSKIKAIVDGNKKVKWVYRHEILENLHSKALNEAIAMECAGEQDESKFWKFTDKIYEITPSNDKLEESKLEEIAREIKLDTKKFKNCVKDQKYKKKIRDQSQEGTLHGMINVGRAGTPYFIIQWKDYEIIADDVNYLKGFVEKLTEYED